jgi:hypothetical protein
MAVYLTKEFARFARKAKLTDAALIEAACDVRSGRYDADMGGGVFKQRIAREGGGKSGGFRAIILFKIGSHAFFTYGFAKNAKANVSATELRALKRLAGIFFGFSIERIRAAETAGELIEVTDDGSNKQKD